MKTRLNLLATGIFLAAISTGLGKSTLQFSTNLNYVTENAGNVILTVQRTGDPTAVVSVDFATADSTATNGLDYTATNGTLTFLAGETNQTLVVPILNDGVVEPAVYETFTVTLSNPTNAVLGTRTVATVRITDNDKGLAFEFASYSVTEDAGSVLIGVVRTDDGDFPLSVDYFTTASTAINGLDFTGVTNTLFFAAGEKVQTFTVPLLNDSLKETSKIFRLALSNPTNQVLGTQKTTTVTILDNDPGVQFEFSQYWVQENEVALTVKALRGNDVNLPLFTVGFATTNLTALAGQDYTETSGTLTFAAGETAKAITVPITYDEMLEADETCKLALLTNGTEGIILGPDKTATITLLDTTGTAAHRFERIALLPDQSVQLTLGGGVSKRFKDYFDLYPIEVSTNLVDWAPLITLQRTNSNTNALTYTDPQAGTASMRFYRTVTNHLITAMLQPTGPYPVGMVNRWLTDSTRRNRFGISTNGSFMIAIWYPALPQAGRLPVSFEDPVVLRDVALVGALIDRYSYFVSHAVIGAPCATDGSPYPIVLFSEGATGRRFGVAEKAENLASHGYAVASIDHFDAQSPAFPDGTVGHLPEQPINTAGFQDRVKDLGLVLDRLANWVSTDPMFAGRFDVSQVAAMGMSWGGGVAGEFAREDERCKLAIMYEGYLQNADELVKQGLSKPTLSIYADPIGIPGQELLLFNKVTHAAIWFQIRSTVHEDFGDWYWSQNPYNLNAGRESARTINAYTLWFLNKYLKGSTDPMPALAAYPRVINFKQK